MAACCVGLGGNVGDVPEAFRDAVRRLRSAGMDVTARSGLYRTAAVGVRAGPAFLNAAITLETTLEPERLLDLLQGVETSLGRTREVHWGPRTIDLDLLLFDSLILQTPRLTLPHPACWYRRFVLDPLSEIAGGWVHPRRRLTIEQLQDRIQPRPLPVVLSVTGPALREELLHRIHDRFGDQVEIGTAADVSSAPALTFCYCDDAAEDVPDVSLVRIEEDVDPIAAVMDVLQAAVDTPERIAGPDAWDPQRN